MANMLPSSQQSSTRLAARIVFAVALLVAVLSSRAFALPANTLWYSGDPNLSNWGNSAADADSLRHWQPFSVTDAAGWTIESVFSVGELFSGTTAEWSIRSGMSTGVAGTTIQSDVGAISTSPVGGFVAIEVDIAPLHLGPGTYWLEVASQGSGSIKGTDGSNAIGTTPNLHSLRLWPLFNQIYQPFSDPKLSSGVTGFVGVAEPATLTLLGLGLAGLGLSLRRRAR